MPAKPTAEDAALVARVAALPADQRERCRQALAQLRRDGRAVTVRALRAEAQVDTGTAGVVLRAWRSRLLDPGGTAWDHLGAPAPGKVPAAPEPLPGGAQLVAVIEAATSPAQVAAVAQRAAALVAQGHLDVATARVLRDLCAEQRRGLMDAARQPAAAAPPEVLVGAEAVELAQLCEGLVSGHRRARLLELARELAREEAERYPVTDPAACAVQLALEGLDAFGQPLLDPPPAS